MGGQVACQYTHFKHNPRQFYLTFKSLILSRKGVDFSCFQQSSILAPKAANSPLHRCRRQSKRSEKSLDVMTQRCREYEARIEHLKARRKRRAAWTKFLELKIGQLFGIFEDILDRRGVDGLEDEDEDGYEGEEVA
jgi:hypothetical protein